MDAVRNVNVLDFRIVVEFFIHRLFAGVGSKTGDIEGSTRSGGVGHVGGIGADTAGAKTSEEGSTVVLLRYGHRRGIEGSAGGLVVYLKGAEDGSSSTRGGEQEGERLDAKEGEETRRERKRLRGVTDVG